MVDIKAKCDENTSSSHPNRPFSFIVLCYNMHSCIYLCVWITEDRYPSGREFQQLCIYQELSALPLFLSASLCLCVCLCVLPEQIKAWLYTQTKKNIAVTVFSTSLVHVIPLFLITYIWFLLEHPASVQSAFPWLPSSITTPCLIKVVCVSVCQLWQFFYWPYPLHSRASAFWWAATDLFPSQRFKKN